MLFRSEMLGSAEQHYCPKPYRGSVVLFFGQGTLDFGPNLGWDGLAERFEHCIIGDEVLDSRRDILNQPLVGITASKLAPFLDLKLEASLPPTSTDLN